MAFHMPDPDQSESVWRSFLHGWPVTGAIIAGLMVPLGWVAQRLGMTWIERFEQAVKDLAQVTKDIAEQAEKQAAARAIQDRLVTDVQLLLETSGEHERRISRAEGLCASRKR